jgi:hypothetical protein
VDARADLEGMEKYLLPLPGIEHQVSSPQPVAIPAPKSYRIGSKDMAISEK